jgi:nicotinamidase-related amidase
VAFDLGYDCTVAHDCCATCDLSWNGVEVAAAKVQASFMAALGAVYGRIAGVDEILSEL